MKILIVNKFLHPNGGSETYIFKLGEELVRQGHEVQYFGMEHPNRVVGNDINEYTSNMDFHTGKIQKLLYPFKIIYSHEAAKKLTKVLDSFKPDVVHVNNFNFQLTPSILYATRKWEKRNNHRVKLIYTAHDGQIVCPNHLMQQFFSKERCYKCIGGSPWNCTKNKCIHGSFVKSLLGSLEAFIYRSNKAYALFDTIICPSRFLEQKLLSLKELTGKTIVLHNFIDVERAIVKKEDYILYFGRYSYEKGVATLLSACRMLPEYDFVFAGSGPLENDVKACKNALNKGFLSGKELEETIAKAKFVVFPSEWDENCPFTVMESLSLGTPLIACNLGGVPELIDDGINGELFTPGDDKELADKIYNLYNDEERLETYRSNVLKTKFDSLESYTKRIIEDIYK